MATETPETTGTATQETGATTQETGAATPEMGAATPDMGAATQETGATTQDMGAATQDMGAATQQNRRAVEHRVAMRRSVVAAGSAGILAVGLLLGMGVTRYASAAPRASAATRTASKPAVAEQRPAPDSGTLEWNPFQAIRHTQQSMDQMFDEMVAKLRRRPPLSGYADEAPGYSLSLRLKDAKDHYEVRGHLPKGGSSNVNVSLMDNQTLRVEVDTKATEETSPKSTTGGSEITEWGQYEQILELPGPVKNNDLQIDRVNGELVVTLPKA
jgi:HSP20 family molecular chaperone IbpA